MSDTKETVLDAIRRRSAQRRDVLKYAGQATFVAGGLTMLSACGGDAFDHTIPPVLPFTTPTPTPVAPAPTSTAKPGIADADIPTINFLLNIAYMHAAFFSGQASGATLLAADISGQGTQGIVTTCAATTLATADANAFAPPFAQEIARNSINRLRKIRAMMGAAAIAAPTIDVSQTTWTPFANNAQIKGNFDPSNGGPTFLPSSIFINAVTLAAFQGALSLLKSADALALISGCVVGLGYDNALIRTQADVQSQVTTATPGGTNAPIKNTKAITDYINNFLLGSGTKDQSIYIGEGSINGGGSQPTAANITAADVNGLAIDRTPARTLNLLFQTASAATSGGFFPNGVNSYAVGGAVVDASLTTSATG